MTCKRRGTEGFTLIELLVVIAIIGILSSVVLTSVNSARTKGRDARRVSDIKQIGLALALYYDDHGSEYPDSICSTVVNGSCTSSMLAPAYFSFAPNDPLATGVTYLYFYDNLTSADGTCAEATDICDMYILGATIESTSYAPLEQDIDGTVQGISCDDPVFCKRP